MLDATPEIYTAVRAALMADATLAGAVGDRISTDWAKTLEPPFIRLSMPQTSKFNDDVHGPGSQGPLFVHVFANGRGSSAREALANRVRAILDEQPLALATSAMWWMNYKDTLRWPDPEHPELQIARLEFHTASTDGN